MNKLCRLFGRLDNLFLEVLHSLSTANPKPLKKPSLNPLNPEALVKTTPHRSGTNVGEWASCSEMGWRSGYRGLTN